MVDVRRLVLFGGFVGSLAGCTCGDATLAPAELAGVLVLDPDQLDFGSVEVGTITELNVAIQNDGRGDLNISNAVGDGTPFLFRAADNSEMIPGGERGAFIVSFTPRGAEAYEGTIAIAHDGLNGPISTLRVRGSGKITPPPPMRKAFEVDPPALDFGSMASGDSRAMTFAVKNVGDVPLDISTITLENADQYRIRFAGTLPAQIAVGDSLSVEVAFNSTLLGQTIGRAVVTTNADEPTKGVDLRGEAYGPEIEVTPPAVEFGVVGINSLAPSKRVVVKNIGNRPLILSSIAFTASSVEIRELYRPLPFSLQPGASVEVELEYDPIDGLVDQGSLVIASDDADERSVTVPISGTGGDPTGCSLATLNSPLDFGYVMRGGRSTLALSLVNVGLQPCALTGASVPGAGPYAVNADRPSTPAQIPPQGVHHVLVDFSPRVYGDVVESVVLETVDVRHRVPMLGSSAESPILALPSTLDFGSVGVGCTSNELRIRLYNRGDQDEDFLNVYFAAGTSADFEGETDDLGDELDNDNSDYHEIFVWHRPTTPGFAAGAIVIEHSGPSSPLVIPIFADATTGSNTTDNFRQSKPARVDVLFVLDGSDDMQLEREQMVAHANAFITAADASAVDYQIGVTSTDVTDDGDQGRIYGGAPAIISLRTADRSAALSSAFGGQLGDDGDEEGIEAAFLGLTDRALNEANAGFHRDGAALSVIYVSNENDHSEWSFSMYRDALSSLKGVYRRAMTSAHAFVGTEDYCDTPDGGAYFGEDYIDFVDSIGGRIESMCTADYARALTSLAEESFGGRRTFHLSSQPAPGLIGVKVNGVAAPDGSVYYLPWANAVRFEDLATPPDGATVELSYSSACY